MWRRRRGYPLSVEDQRDLLGYDGLVFVWDVDKTYLNTRFSTLEGISRIPMEFAVDKHAIPGMPEVLRGMRRGTGDGFQCVPLYFVSASPPQLRRVIERKMLIDGVEHDGLIFKDWLGALRSLRPGRLREQLGFKVIALLNGRTRRPHAREILVGDDSERDAEAFSLYARLLAGELDSAGLESALAVEGVHEEDRQYAVDLLRRLPPDARGSVERIFIHQAYATPRAELEQTGPLVVAVANAAELAVAAYGLDLVKADTVSQAIAACERSGQTIDAAALIEDSVDRALLSRSRAAGLVW
jgi:hypothetical protein